RGESDPGNEGETRIFQNCIFHPDLIHFKLTQSHVLLRSRARVAAGPVVRDDALECRTCRRSRFVARSAGGAGEIVQRLLVSALCICAPTGSQPGGCAGFDASVLRQAAGEEILPSCPEGTWPVSDVPADIAEKLFVARMEADAERETRRGQDSSVVGSN